MNALAVTAADLATALRHAAPAPWEEIVVNDEVVGSLAMTAREDPEMRWFWQGMGSEGHAATRAAAVAAIKAHVLCWWPRHKADWAAEAVRRAEIAALPEPLRRLAVEIAQAGRRVEIERARGIVRKDDLERAEEQLRHAEIAFAAAERMMAEAA